jgi:hypothetical protein
MTKNLSNKIFLKRQLYSLWMKEGMKINDHLNVFNTLICQLTSKEVKFEDEDKYVTLWCLLPESWDYLVTTMFSERVNELNLILGQRRWFFGSMFLGILWYCVHEFHVMKAIKVLLNSILNGPRGKR